MSAATLATLVYEDGKASELPTEQSQMTYYCRKAKLNDGRSLADVFESARFVAIPLEQSREETVDIDPPQAIEPPDTCFYPAGVVIAIKAKITARMGRAILGNAMIDPGLISFPVIYTDAVTGEATRFNIGELPLGVKRVSVGKFYFSYHPPKYYYCDRIIGDIVRWHLIESFQNGEMVAATFTQNIKRSPSFIPVSDKTTLNRLQRRLEDYRQRSAKIG